MTQTKEKESSFLMVKLTRSLKKELWRVAGEEDLDMSKATRQALEEWIARTKSKQARRAAKASSNGS